MVKRTGLCCGAVLVSRLTDLCLGSRSCDCGCVGVLTELGTTLEGKSNNIIDSLGAIACCLASQA